MPIPIALIMAGVAAAASTTGAVGSASKRKQAQEEETRNYRAAKDYLNSMYYRDPLTTAGNLSLIKMAKQGHKDNLDAIQNRMAAGGGTMENALAARQANNESLDKLYGQLLLGEDARRDRIANQQLQLEAQHSGNVQNSYYQAAQDWQAWGGQVANAALSYGSSNLLGGSGGLKFGSKPSGSGSKPSGSGSSGS